MTDPTDLRQSPHVPRKPQCRVVSPQQLTADQSEHLGVARDSEYGPVRAIRLSRVLRGT
jgi:hypothetical protein